MIHEALGETEDSLLKSDFPKQFLIDHAESYVNRKRVEQKYKRCASCWLDVRESCICHQLPKISFSNRLRVIVYMDFKEYLNPGDDAKLILCTSPHQSHLVLYPFEDHKLIRLLDLSTSPSLTTTPTTTSTNSTPSSTSKNHVETFETINDEMQSSIFTVIDKSDCIQTEAIDNTESISTNVNTKTNMDMQWNSCILFPSEISMSAGLLK